MNCRIVYFFVLSGFLLLLNACSDFLTEQPDDARPAGKALASAEDLREALNGCYRLMTDIDYYGRRFILYADMKGGDFAIPALGRADDPLYTFTHETGTSSYGMLWEKIYAVLLQANHLIAAIESGAVSGHSEKDDKTINDMMGQALTIRGLCHFDLLRLYSYPFLKDNGTSLGVAVITHLPEPKELFERKTVMETYLQIIQDMENAIPLLNTEKTNGYINQWVAKALLARIYLYKGDWDNAFLLSEEIINSGNYTLYSNEAWEASWKNEFGEESVFELKVNPLENDLEGSSLTYFFRPRTVTSEAMAAAFLSDSFLSVLNEDSSDIRHSMTGLDEYALDNRIPERKGRILKYEGDGKSTATATNIKVVRLSEIYLIAAEAALKKTEPDAEQAVSFLNRIRQRSPSSTVIKSSDSDIEEQILKERRKELFAEGHRFFDCMRLGKTIHYDPPLLGEPEIPLNGRHSSIGWNYHKCVLPIPIEEILANSLIAGQQNPDY